jgi:radical SAM protein with 4Fe4S-binding SPASM domain
MEKLTIPKIFSVQWYITERCNFRCKFCYQSDHPVPDLSLDQLFLILDKFVELIKKWNLPQDRARLVLTGGEPLIRPDFFQFIERVYELSKGRFRWSLLSNGSLLDEEKVLKLKKFGISSYQVSMNGMRDKTDELMGRGNFDRITKAINLLVAAKIPAVVSFTMTKKNIDEVPALVDYCQKLGVNSIGTRRLIPWGRGKELEEYVLTPQELRNYYMWVKERNKKLAKSGTHMRIGIGCETAIFNEEIFDDPESGMDISLCGLTCGRCFTIMANGDLMHCRRLPLPMGNALKDDLYEFWYSKPMRDLRDLEQLDPICKKCDNFVNCFSGARCIAYAQTGELHVPDPQCWRIKNNETK